MELAHITYEGPEFDEDSPIIERLPADLIGLLRQINGFVQSEGALHVRGVCAEPRWHSLDLVMDGPLAFHRHYRDVVETDVPFAQDCVADQFLLRGGSVVRLFAETGEMEPLNTDLQTFLARAQGDPVDFLGMHPLLQAQSEGKRLKPGQVLNVYPPFCTEESGTGVSLRPISSEEAIGYLESLSQSLETLEDGQKFRITFED